MKRFKVPQKIRELMWEIDCYGREFRNPDQDNHLDQLYYDFSVPDDNDEINLAFALTKQEQQDEEWEERQFSIDGITIFYDEDSPLIQWTTVLGGGLYPNEIPTTTLDQEVNKVLEVVEFNKDWYLVKNPKKKFDEDPEFHIVRKTFVHKHFEGID